MTLHESDTQEFKKSISLTEPALKSVCGFLNHHGGVISFGRTNTGAIVGVDPTDHSLRKLSQKIASRIKPEISPYIRVIEEQGKHLIVVTVPEGISKPYYLDGIAYMRTGTENRVLPPDEIKRMILTINQPPWDREICLDATIDDIDAALIYNFLAKAKDERRHDADASASVSSILEETSSAQKWRADERCDPDIRKRPSAVHLSVEDPLRLFQRDRCYQPLH